MTTSQSSTAAIQQALQDHAIRHGNRPAVIEPTAVLTFSELWQQARARAADRGPRPGTVVAIAARSTAAFLVEVAATWLSHAVPMPLDPKAPQEVRQAMIRRVGTGQHTCGPWKAVLTVVGGSYRPLFTGGESPTVPRKADAVGLGSTPGIGVAVGRQPVALFASPMHLNGPFEFAVRHLLRGGTVAVLDRFDAHRWVQFADHVKPDWAFLAPIQIARLVDTVDSSRLAGCLGGIRTLLHSAAPCPPALRSRLVDLVGPQAVAEYYGAAEYDGTFTRADAAHSGGLPIPGARLRVVDGTGRPVPAGVVGTIEGRSAAGLRNHYAGEPCTSANLWRTVGDCGRIDETGRLTVTGVDASGRAIVGGVNVPLARVHAVIAAHPAVITCQVVPVPDDTYGQVLNVRVTTDRPLTTAVLHAFCAERLRPAERPQHLQIILPDQSTLEDDHAPTV